MVLCKYFVYGNCRFGSKCVNEHFDIKVLLKADVDAALNGNQWPLSSFGPFKEKISIPNFIEDQSFEEIRMLCYGAKKQNFFDTFNQQFTKEVIEAKNKMKMLLSLSKEVADVIIAVYNSAEPTKTSTQSNPFGLGSMGTAQQNNNNLFGQTQQPSQGSIFGGATTVTPFGGNNNANANVGNSIFGGQQKTVLGQSSFAGFGGQQQQQPATQGQSLFGSQQPQQQQTQQSSQGQSMFGNHQPQQQQPQQTNIFGGSIFGQQNQSSGNSIFGGQQPQVQQPQQTFGGNTTSVFGQQQNAGNIFAQAAQQTQQPPPCGGYIFAQAVQQTQPPAFGMFSQPAAQQAPPAFGAQLSQTSPFNTAQQQQQQKQLFGQNSQPQQNMGSLFATQIQQQQQQQQQQAPQGLFAGVAANSPFGAPQNQQQQQTPANTFAQVPVSLPQQQLPPQSLVNDRTYSKLENLTQQEIEAFQADHFELGKVPLVPPPRELIN